MKPSACSGNGRITKGALLSMMGDKPFSPPKLTPTELLFSEEKKDRILDVIEKNGGSLQRASVVLGISTASLKRWVDLWNKPPKTPEQSQSTNSTRRFYESITRPWSIRSFNPETREVCIEIKTRSCLNNLVYTIPAQKIPE